MTHDFPSIGRKTFLLNASRLYLQTTQAEMILLAFDDITEKNQAALDAAHLAAIVNTSNDAIISKTMDGAILSWNAGAERLFGYKFEEVKGKNISLFTPSDEPAEEAQILERIKAGKHIDLYEAKGIRKDGSEFPIEVSLSPLKTSKGPLISSSIRDVTERKASEEKIKKSLHEKEALLKEIHHRVKNNLQITSGLLSLQAQSIKDPATKELFFESELRIKSLALIHEKLYQSSNLSEIDIAEYITDLVPSMLKSYARSEFHAAIDVKLHLTNVFLPIEKAIPFGLILNELISNAAKHAFPEGQSGQITILLDYKDGDCVLVVCDNGVGMPEGLDIKQSKTLGLNLVSSLVEQLGGEITLSRDGKTEFTISFKK